MKVPISMILCTVFKKVELNTPEDCGAKRSLLSTPQSIVNITVLEPKSKGI
jgi:hypothetical protein